MDPKLQDTSQLDDKNHAYKDILKAPNSCRDEYQLESKI